MKLELTRYCYSETETEGMLRLGDGTELYTLERPWIAGMPGGVSFESCVPDGEYSLLPHKRPNGDDVFALWNPDLGVYYEKSERGENEGRYLILIHVGNFVDNVVGCIAPGTSRTIHNNMRMVTNSKVAMGKVMADDYDNIIIKAGLGAK